MFKKIKLIGIAAVTTAFFAVAPVVYGGLNWTGIDPILQLSNGDIVNVDVAVPPEAWTQIKKKIKVKITAPDGTILLEELTHSSGVYTKTNLKTKDSKAVKVQVLVRTKGNVDAAIPAQVMISQAGTELKTCDGMADEWFKCRAKVDLDDDDEDDDDDDEEDDD